MKPGIRTRQRRGAAGFSLVETVIAVGIVALIAATLFGAVEGGYRILNAVAADDRHIEERLRLARAFGPWIEAASAADSPADPLAPRAALFSGRDDAVTYLATFVDPTGGSGLYRVRLAIEQIDPGTSMLVAQRARLVPTASTDIVERPSARTVLYRHKGMMSFAFRASTSNTGADQSWRRGPWQDESVFPGGVAVIADGRPIATGMIRVERDPACMARFGVAELDRRECMLQ